MAWESAYAQDHIGLLVRLKEVLSGYPVVTNPIHTTEGTLADLHTANSASAQTWTVTCTNDLLPATFSVVGSVSGAQASATVGTPYSNSQLSFIIYAGGTAFQVGDSFVFDVALNDMVASSTTWTINRFTGTGAQPLAYVASSYFGAGKEAFRAFDGNSATWWATADNSPTNSWLRVQFTKAIAITRVLIRPGDSNNSGSTNNRAPRDFTIDYSDNGTSWTTALTVTNQTAWSTEDTRQFTLSSPGAHTYWRVNITANNGNTDVTTISSLQMYDATELVDVAKEGDGPELVATGPGTFTGDGVIAGIRCYRDEGHDIYNWQLKGLLGFSSGLSFWNQAFDSDSPYGVSSEICLYKEPFKYWIIANGRRFIVIAKVFGNCEAAHMGFILAYATPSQYPYPYLVGGSICTANTTLASINHRERADSGHRLFASPGQGNTYLVYGPSATRMFLPSNAWKFVSNRLHNIAYASDQIDHSTSSLKTYPYNTDPVRIALDHDSYADLIEFQPDGYVPLYPIQYMDTVSGFLLGELEGVRAVLGSNTTSEDIIDDGVDKWVVVNNVFRPEYFAVRLK